jgi:hypothetical protein
MMLGSVGANGHILQTGLWTVFGKVARDAAKKNRTSFDTLAYKGYD